MPRKGCLTWAFFFDRPDPEGKNQTRAKTPGAQCPPHLPMHMPPYMILLMLCPRYAFATVYDTTYAPPMLPCKELFPRLGRRVSLAKITRCIGSVRFRSRSLRLDAPSPSAKDGTTLRNILLWLTITPTSIILPITLPQASASAGYGETLLGQVLDRLQQAHPLRNLSNPQFTNRQNIRPLTCDCDPCYLNRLQPLVLAIPV